jgi:hypothetical protein
MIPSKVSPYITAFGSDISCAGKLGRCGKLRGRTTIEFSLLCIAHRARGVTHWFADGDFAAAQVELERAIDLHNPSKDRELAHRFGQDIGVAAKVYLAPVLWSRGDAAASRGMINDAISAALETAHPPTIAYTHFFIAVLELMRLDPGRAKAPAEACLALAQQHGLAVWLLIGPVVHSWSIAALNRTQSLGTNCAATCRHVELKASERSLPGSILRWPLGRRRLATSMRL